MLAVTGIGMVSSLGLDAVMSCAAARAGIRRITEVDDLFVEDLRGDESAPVAVHCVPRLSTGMFGFARLLQLGSAGLEDLLRAAPGPREERLAMILIVDAKTYQAAWSLRLRKKAAEAAAAAGEPQDEPPSEARARASYERIVKSLLPALVKAAGIAVDSRLQVTLGSTAVGLVAALRQAEEWLSRRLCDRCIVGGLDSLSDPATLAALDGLGLLRTPDRAVGLIPGEASCFVALERPKEAKARQSPIHALVDSATMGREPAHPQLEEDSAEGGGLRAAIAELTAGLPDSGAATGLAVANLNGDPYRAMSWGRCVIPTDSPLRLGSLELWVPPLYFGDIGAATGPVSIALLVRGWARRYAPPSNAIICLMDDRGARGAVYVRPPQEADA